MQGLKWWITAWSDKQTQRENLIKAQWGMYCKEEPGTRAGLEVVNNCKDGSGKQMQGWIGINKTWRECLTNARMNVVNKRKDGSGI